MADQITVTEAAKRLGISRSRIHALIRAGRLAADLVGMQYLIQPRALAAVKDRKPGRPASKPVGKGKASKKK